MTSESRFVFDTNVIVSAVLLRRSVSRQAFDEALARGKILVSSATLAELNDVLRRPRFEPYLGEEERLQFLAAFVREAEFLEITEGVRESRDPKDDKFLELAASGNAVCIVSGDADLLVLHPWRGIPIVTPRAFLEGTRENEAAPPP